jgi:hypothetical protein
MQFGIDRKNKIFALCVAAKDLLPVPMDLAHRNFRTATAARKMGSSPRHEDRARITRQAMEAGNCNAENQS